MEIWKDIEDYEGLYQVSNLGRVKRLSKPKKNYNINSKSFEIIMIPEKIVKPQLDKNRYYRIGLTKDYKRSFYFVHRLVAQAFISNSDNLSYINHKDEDKTNNYVDNLEWCTMKYNCNYGTRNERVAKCNHKKVRCIETGTIYNSLTEACKITGISIR